MLKRIALFLLGLLLASIQLSALDYYVGGVNTGKDFSSQVKLELREPLAIRYELFNSNKYKDQRLELNVSESYGYWSSSNKLRYEENTKLGINQTVLEKDLKVNLQGFLFDYDPFGSVYWTRENVLLAYGIDIKFRYTLNKVGMTYRKAKDESYIKYYFDTDNLGISFENKIVRGSESPKTMMYWKGSL